MLLSSIIVPCSSLFFHVYLCLHCSPRGYDTWSCTKVSSNIISLDAYIIDSLRQNHFVDIVSVQICYLAIVCKFVHTYIIYIFDFSVLPDTFSQEHFSYLTVPMFVENFIILPRQHDCLCLEKYDKLCIEIVKYRTRILSYDCPFLLQSREREKRGEVYGASELKTHERLHSRCLTYINSFFLFGVWQNRQRILWSIGQRK